MNARVMLSSGLLIVLSLPVLSAFAQSANPVATVAGRRIEREEYEQRLGAARAQMATRQGSVPAEMQDVLRRQMLETMIRLNLLTLEALRTGVTASDAEAESALKTDALFSPGGRHDPQRWQLTRTTQPERFQVALTRMREQLAARKLEARLQARFRPSDDVLRNRALHQLRRAVSDDLSLSARDFSGNYPEPRESELLGYYRDNAAQFRRPARAVLSVVFVNEPPRTEAEVRDVAAGAAWLARMRRAADSIMVAVRGGASLEQASATYGGPRGDVTVLPDNLPGYWKGDAATTAAVFKGPEGALMREPVPGTDGYLVVRVDRLETAHIAPLASVAREIRGSLRDDARLHHDERERRALYGTLRDSLSGPAWTFRWGAVDTATVRVGEPSEADLDRWYRGHLADFSSFDSRTGTIVAKTLAEVREEARARWKRDRRVATARQQADDLYRAWSSGRRNPTLESALRVRETSPSPLGADVDTGFAAAALSDTVWKRGEPSGAGLAPYARGFLVWQVTARIASHTPDFVQVEPALRVALEGRQRAIDEAGARKLFERDARRFGMGKRYHFTRLTVSPPPITSIKLTRAEVERWHRRNIEKYSAEELVRAKHILVSPLNSSAAADRTARVRADSLLARIRDGDDFDAIAARFSDDPATKDKGGDLGVFRRGAMLEAFEQAAFAMQAGQLGGPVKTEVGYHIIQCTEHVDAYVQPLKLVYSIVASDLARAMSDTLAMRRADSLLRVIRTPVHAAAAGRRFGYEQSAYVLDEDDTQVNTMLKPYFAKLFAMKPGQVMDVKWLWKGGGYWITWLDSIAAPVAPRWETARNRALEAYRASAGERALLAKTQELDSLAASGWSMDSLGALWGGLKRSREIAPAPPGELAGSAATMDSLLFGGRDGSPALAVGQTSGWVPWPGGLAKVRLFDRREPPADRLRVRMEELRRISMERRFAAYYQDLRKRSPVRILDRSLEAIPLPEIPSED